MKYLKILIKNINQLNLKILNLIEKIVNKMIYFLAINGNNSNGNDYIDKAICNGAKVIVSDQKFEGFNKRNILFVHSKNPRELLSETASKIYNLKPKNIIGVTGTNGKTSIVNFYYQILTLNNKKCFSGNSWSCVKKI